jgi:hypothetical protein
MRNIRIETEKGKGCRFEEKVRERKGRKSTGEVVREDEEKE